MNTRIVKSKARRRKRLDAWTTDFAPRVIPLPALAESLASAFKFANAFPSASESHRRIIE